MKKILCVMLVFLLAGCSVKAKTIGQEWSLKGIQGLSDKSPEFELVSFKSTNSTFQYLDDYYIETVVTSFKGSYNDVKMNYTITLYYYVENGADKWYKSIGYGDGNFDPKFCKENVSDYNVDITTEGQRAITCKAI